MRYVTVSEAIHIATRLLGVSPEVLLNDHVINLLDSALHAPQATFDGVDLVVGLEAKAETLAFHVSRNHPLPDGNKRLAWMIMNVFLELNGHELDRDELRAVCLMWAVAAGEADTQAIQHVISWWVRPLQQAAV